MRRFIRGGASGESGDRHQNKERAHGYKFPHKLVLLEMDETFPRLFAIICSD